MTTPFFFGTSLHSVRFGEFKQTEVFMKMSRLPRIDSIKKLAEFWDRHELTEFDDDLEEVAEPVFVRGTAINVPLAADVAEAVERMARDKGVTREELVRAWVVQKVSGRKNRRTVKR